ncbi:MAG TPA: hypothetical protein VF747_16165 [Blastocatellia bacterium]|jgi:hypothetical protein
MAKLAELILKVCNLALEFLDLMELPVNSVLKRKKGGGSSKQIITQMLSDEGDDGLRAAGISMEDSLTR